jgi:hypothetical protein
MEGKYMKKHEENRLLEDANIVLLGDSTLDNGTYTKGGPSVAELLQRKAGPGCRVFLLAVDGHRIRNVYNQLKNIPEDATHLVLSVGGNDALGYGYILENDAKGFHPVLTELGNIYRGFKNEYSSLIQKIKELKLPLIISTIYRGDFGDTGLQWKADTALTGFNDAIISCAVEESLPVIDLRRACCKTEHFTQQIEPSGPGGKRIAEAIWKALVRHDFAAGGIQIYG